MQPGQPLPIDECLPAIAEAVAARGAAVIEAPPGAGKTTRVPRALLDGGAGGGEIWVLEPRRLPARLAATRVANELGERVGETVGYSVRFDEAVGPKTRLRFMTEGLFVRRLLAAPRLPGVGAVVLDELHERHVATDLALAWLRRLRDGDRPDLAVVAMSATFDADPIADFLGGAVVRSEGRMFDVAIEYLPAPDDRPLAAQVAGAVRRVLRDDKDGDVLVFLPGAGEIKRAQAALAETPGIGAFAVLPLHGEMPLEDQARAVRPGDRRKIILSTNVAESSVTIEGVTAVIDSGLARMAAHSPWTGLPTLAVARISRAAATQRAGRAGRTRPGRALRLYTRHDFEQRPSETEPEIARADLTEVALVLATLGVGDADNLAWLDPPPAAAWGAARELLARLGAVDRDGRLTDVGRRMSRLPVHPRLARLVVEGETRGVGAAASLAATLIAERDIRLGARASFGGGPPGAPSDRGADVLDLVDLFQQAAEARFRPDVLRRLELDRRATEEVDRARRALVGGDIRGANDHALRLAILSAFPDRVARRREPRGRAVVLAAGGSAELGYEANGDWLVAVDAEERSHARAGKGPRGGGVEVRLGSAIEPEWLLDLFADRIEEVDRRVFDERTLRVERTTGLRYGALMLEESAAPAPLDEETGRLLADAVLARGLEKLPGGDALPALLQRLAFARRQMPDAFPSPGGGDGDLAGLVRAACTGAGSVAALGDPAALVLSGLPPAAQRALHAAAPERITLASGRSVPVHYDAGDTPWIESRLQDFFGTRAVPGLGPGRIALTVHLLAPNGRAVQVTRDLENFWTQHYPTLRRQLSRRYPKHSWPEDGATAKPPPPLPPRQKR
ncbi:MAG TPA: ATP-dependent helicase HrpB, partial [Polyangia bacterium]|nr:ATP-dependent helicase HrpB [Polyangia bacterium]